MSTRKQKVEELMERMHSLRRSMAFRPERQAGLPRITPSQWGALMLIGQGRGKTVKDVAGALSVSSSAATQLIDGLANSGYVVREEDPKDRRRVTLALSKKSTARVGVLKKQSLVRVLKLFSALNDREFDQYLRLSTKIVDGAMKNNHGYHEKQ